jgi:thiol-disulfide isomerase/thioredoxin
MSHVRHLPLALLLGAGCIPVLHSPDGGADDTGAWVAPTNEWPVATPPEGLESEGWDEGEVVPDFLLPDQHEDNVSLWQFYGMVTVVDVSTSWCAPCQQLAGGVQAIADDYRADGVEYVTMLDQNLEHETPSIDDLNEWGDYFGIAEPIVADTTAWTSEPYPAPDYPILLLVGRDMRMIGRISQSDDEAVRAAIEAAL